MRPCYSMKKIFTYSTVYKNKVICEDGGWLLRRVCEEDCFTYSFVWNLFRKSRPEFRVGNIVCRNKRTCEDVFFTTFFMYYLFSFPGLLFAHKKNVTQRKHSYAVKIKLSLLSQHCHLIHEITSVFQQLCENEALYLRIRWNTIFFII